MKIPRWTLTTLLVVAVFSWIATSHVSAKNPSKTAEPETVSALSNLQLQLLALGPLAEDAVNGDAKAFEQLASGRQAVEGALNRILELDVSPSMKIHDYEVEYLHSMIVGLLGRMDVILEKRDAIITSAGTAVTLRNRLLVLDSKIQMLAHLLNEREDRSMNVHHLEQMQTLTTGMAQGLGGVLEEGSGTAAVDVLDHQFRLMDRMIDALIIGSEEFEVRPLEEKSALTSMGEIYQIWSGIGKLYFSLIDKSIEVVLAKKTASHMRLQIGETNKNIEEIKVTVSKRTH